MATKTINSTLRKFWIEHCNTTHKHFNPAPIGLGLSLRANVLQLHLGPRKEVAEILNELGLVPEDMNAVTFCNQITTGKRPIQDRDVSALEKLVEYAAKLPSFGNRLCPLTWSAFHTTRFDGEDALDDFQAWLLTGALTPVDRIPAEGVLPKYIPSQERHKQLDAIMAFIGKSDRQMVQQVVCGASNTVAISALAGKIIERQLAWRNGSGGADRRRICYIPGRRRGKNRSVVTLAWIVSELDAFFSGEKDPNRRNEITTLSDFYDAVRRIREGMIAHPAILIIDDYRGAEIVNQAASLILDGGLFDLLTHLTDPRFTGNNRPEQIAGYRNNRIIVLTEAEDARLKDLTPPVIHHAVLKGTELNKAIDISNLRNKNDLKQAVAKYGSLGDAGLDLLDTVRNMSFSQQTVTETLAGAGGAYGSGLAKAFMRNIAQSRGFDALLICWIALSETGLRPQTLKRLLLQLKHADDEAGSQISERDINIDYIIERLAQYKPMLVSAHDERDTLLSHGPAPIQAFENVRAHTEPVEAPSPIIFEFSTVTGREWILNYIRADEKNRRRYALMTMLLAEEALRQMSATIRRSETGSPFNARRHRRIVEALSYGLQSLQILHEERAARTGDSKIALPARLDHILPSDPAEILRRLYALFHRNVLQAPPDHELTRSLGRPDVVFDLWKVAWSSHRGLLEFFDDETAQSKSDNFSSQPLRNIRLELDMLESLAKNAFQANRLDETETMIQRWEEAINRAPYAPESSPAIHLKVELAKIKIDLELAKANPNSAAPGADGYEATLKLAYNTDLGLREKLEALVKEINAQPINPTDWSIESLYQTHAQANETYDEVINHLFSGARVQDYQHAADLLSRLAEAKSIEAETLHDTPRAGYPVFYTAYRMHILAGRLRRAAFKADPLSRAFVVNAHSSRNYIRVCLKLYAILKRGDAHANKPHEDRENLMAYFAYAAQKNLDIVTRHTYRFPSERPSLMALEAMIIRVCHDRPDLALDLLLLADDQSVTLARPRISYRLVIERVKCLRALADHCEDETDKLALYQAAAECLLPLKNQIKEKNGLWCYIRKIQIDSIAKKIEDKPSLKEQFERLNS